MFLVACFFGAFILGAFIRFGIVYIYVMWGEAHDFFTYIFIYIYPMIINIGLMRG